MLSRAHSKYSSAQALSAGLKVILKLLRGEGNRLKVVSAFQRKKRRAQIASAFSLLMWELLEPEPGLQFDDAPGEAARRKTEVRISDYRAGVKESERREVELVKGVKEVGA